jgi:hypothetical protein
MYSLDSATKERLYYEKNYYNVSFNVDVFHRFQS